MSALLVFVGAMIGAPLRYFTDRQVRSWQDGSFPWGTLVVNVTGSLILGVLAGAGGRLPDSMAVLLGTGFCGALTTYSTFGYETLRLVEQRMHFYAAVNVVLSVIAGLGAALLGYSVTAALFP